MNAPVAHGVDERVGLLALRSGRRLIPMQYSVVGRLTGERFGSVVKTEFSRAGDGQDFGTFIGGKLV